MTLTEMEHGEGAIRFAARIAGWESTNEESANQGLRRFLVVGSLITGDPTEFLGNSAELVNCEVIIIPKGEIMKPKNDYRHWRIDQVVSTIGDMNNWEPRFSKTQNKGESNDTL